MQEASGLLGKFKQLLEKKEKTLEVVVDVIKNKTGIEIEKKNLKIKGKKLKTNLTGSQKTQLFFNKEEIIKEINQKLEKVTITDLY